jgi:hypothetical protein
MSGHSIPLNELNAAVQNAVQQALGKHGAVPIDQLWVGFVAPEAIANEEAAAKIASELSKGATGRVQPSVQVLAPAQGEKPGAHLAPPRIIGLIFDPQAKR